MINFELKISWIIGILINLIVSFYSFIRFNKGSGLYGLERLGLLGCSFVAYLLQKQAFSLSAV